MTKNNAEAEVYRKFDTGKKLRENQDTENNLQTVKGVLFRSFPIHFQLEQIGKVEAEFSRKFYIEKKLKESKNNL